MIAIEPADAWIFLAIARSDGAELADFYSAADHIGVAIPPGGQQETRSPTLLRPAHSEVIAQGLRSG